MCYHTKQTADKHKLQKRFNAGLIQADEKDLQKEHFNGFEFPQTPVITNAQPDTIQLFHWGLLPSWASIDHRLHTLNAKIETLNEKASFKEVLHQKCLVLLTGFYEWQWLDNKGKRKQQYLLHLPDDEPFALAGLWSEWKNQDGTSRHTYTILTTEARGIMREIHNSKLRMPVILDPTVERDWLEGRVKSRLHSGLMATPV